MRRSIAEELCKIIRVVSPTLYRSCKTAQNRYCNGIVKRLSDSRGAQYPSRTSTVRASPSLPVIATMTWRRTSLPDIS
eukprot:195821-Rhodomonas_salina.2